MPGKKKRSREVELFVDPSMAHRLNCKVIDAAADKRKHTIHAVALLKCDNRVVGIASFSISRLVGGVIVVVYHHLRGADHLAISNAQDVYYQGHVYRRTPVKRPVSLLSFIKRLAKNL